MSKHKLQTMFFLILLFVTAANAASLLIEIVDSGDNPVIGYNVSLMNMSQYEISALTNATGEYIFTGMASGLYSLQRGDEQSQYMDLNIEMPDNFINVSADENLSLIAYNISYLSNMGGLDSLYHKLETIVVYYNLSNNDVDNISGVTVQLYLQNSSDFGDNIYAKETDTIQILQGDYEHNISIQVPSNITEDNASLVLDIYFELTAEDGVDSSNGNITYLNQKYEDAFINITESSQYTNITVVKTTLTPSILDNQTAEFMINITNIGDTNITLENVTDYYTVSEFNYLASNPTADDTTDANIEWYLGVTLETNESTIIYLNLTPETNGTFTNYVNVTTVDVYGNTTFVQDSSQIEVNSTADVTAPVISSVTNGTTTNITVNITWSTDEASNSSVNYGLTVGLGTEVGQNDNTLSHGVYVSGLTNGTMYFYNVTSCDVSDNCETSGPFNFTTVENLPDTTPPHAITNIISGAVSMTVINWAWINPIDSDFDVNLIYRDSVNIMNTSNAYYNGTGLNCSTIYNLTVHTMDSNGNINTTDITNLTSTSACPDITAPVISSVTNGTTTNSTVNITWSTDEASNSSVNYGISLALSSYENLNNTILSHGVYITSLTNGTMYFYNVTSCDTSSNCNTSGPFNFTTVENPEIDSISPTFTTTPTNQVVEYNVAFGYDIDATDNVALDSYAVNDIDFAINGSGYLSNDTLLTLGTHVLNITINDTSGNLNSAVITVDVQDNTVPYFNPTPTDQIVYYGNALSYDIDAFDNKAVSGYSVNDTTNFAISGAGVLSNDTLLSVGTFGVLVTVNDTSGNENTTSFTVTVKQNSTTAVTANISTDVDFSEASANITLYLAENVTTSIVVAIQDPTTTPTTSLIALKGNNITVDSSTSGNLTWAMIKIYYTDAELTAANVVESSLKMYYYNDSSSSWQLEPNQGVNTGANYVWANVTHFSLYGIFGTAPVTVTPTTESSSSSGGGGITTLPDRGPSHKWANVQPNRDYTFSIDGLQIAFREIVWQINERADYVAMTILRTERPTVDYGDNVYQYIRVDTTGIQPGALEKADIKFSVPVEFLEDRNSNPNDVEFYGLQDGEWVLIDASLDYYDSIAYYTAKADMLEEFAIAYKVELEVSPGEETEELIEEVAEEEETIEDKMEESAEVTGKQGMLNSTKVLITTAVIILIAALIYLWYNKPKPYRSKKAMNYGF